MVELIISTRSTQLYFQLHLHYTTEKGKETWSKLCPDGQNAACCHCPCYTSRSWRKGFAFFLSLCSYPSQEKPKNVWKKRQAARAKKGRKPSEVKRTEFQLFNDFMTTISFKCWSLSGWLQQISTISHTCHTTKLHSRVQQPKSHLHDWAALLLYSEYIIYSLSEDSYFSCLFQNTFLNTVVTVSIF